MENAELIKALKEDAEWAHANEWETPITLGDNLNGAADLIESLQAQLAERDKELKRPQKEVAALAIESIEREKTLARLEAEVMVWAKAERDGLCVVLPCKRGDACFEIGSGHGITRHTVKGITVYSRGADGQRYLNDINNSIVIDTWAVGDDGCEWSDHYTPEEWEKAPKTRAEAEAALAKEDKP